MDRENVAPAEGAQTRLVAPDMRIEIHPADGPRGVIRLHAAHFADPRALLAALGENMGLMDAAPLDHDAGLRLGVTIRVLVNDAGSDAFEAMFERIASFSESAPQ